MTSSDIIRQAIEMARAGRKAEARDTLLKVVEADPYNEIAWIWLSGLVDALEDRIIACENALTINPSNEKVREYLNQLLQKQQAIKGRQPPPINQPVPAHQPVSARQPTPTPATRPPAHARKDPMLTAAHLEQDGKYSEALELYKIEAARIKDPQKFDEIYKHIIRIENLQKEKIRHVSPALSIARMTFTWPLVYFLFVFLHSGFNPIAHLNVILWLGLPAVVAGSFLLAVSEIRSQHSIWKKLFDEDGDGSQFARITAAVTGWLLIIFPHMFLLLNALNRLRNFSIPPRPF